MTKRVIHQLKKKGQLEMFQKEINKKIEIGTLVAMSDAKVKETMKSTHNFTLLARVRPNKGFFKFGRSRTFQNPCSVNRSRTLEIEVRLNGTELLC